MHHLASTLLLLATSLAPVRNGEIWLRFASGRTAQTFAPSIPCNRSTVFRFAIAPGEPLHTEIAVAPRDFRDDRLDVVSSLVGEAVGGRMRAVAAAGSHSVTVTPHCGSSKARGRVRVLIRLAIHSAPPRVKGRRMPR